MPEFFPENNTTLKTDTEVRSLQKISSGIDNLSNPFSSGSIIGSFPTDAFGRLRTVAPLTLFDSNHRFQDNGLWSTYTSGTASVVFNSEQGLVDLIIGGDSGDLIIRETTKVFAYQPGKSLLVMNTFVMYPALSNLRQRVGYYGDNNGMYLELYGSAINLVERTAVEGSVAETSVLQDDWNGDKLNGTGASGLTLDLTKAQILWMDIEWLGVGTVRMGFVINGQFIVCHSFHHANLLASTYITTASLPLRYEIENVAATDENNVTLKQICSTVISEGGYSLRGAQQQIALPVKTPRTLTTSGTYYPVISIKLKTSPDRLDAIVIPTDLSIIPTTASNYHWQLVAGGTTAAGSWVSAGSTSSVQYNISGTSFSGGRIVAGGFFSQSNQSSTAIHIGREDIFKFQLERDGIVGTPYELTLVVSASVNTSDVLASIDWEEVTR
jgi:hypothetical protein